MAAVKREEADVRVLINRALTKTRVADERFNAFTMQDKWGVGVFEIILVDIHR